MENNTKQENYIINNSRLKLTIDDILQAVSDYCIQCDVSKPEALTSQQFSGLCNYIGTMFFKTSKALFLHEPNRETGVFYTSGFMLIPALIETLLDVYIFLCQRYNKKISVYDFGLFIGSDSMSLNRWLNEDINDMDININNSRVIFDSDNNIYINMDEIKKRKYFIAQKIYNNAKESFFNALGDNKNAIAQIQYGRSKGFISALEDTRSSVQVKLSLSADDLPKLTG